MPSDSSRQPTIHTVATRAGVSKSLVSLVLQGSPNVSERRRKDVVEAIEALGYRPNALARGLVKQRTNVFGVLTSDIHNPFFAEVVNGVQEQSMPSGYQVVVGIGGRDPEAEAKMLDTFLELRVDALIVLSPMLDPQGLVRRAQFAPILVVGRRGVRIPHTDTIINDDLVGAQLVVDHLAGLGHESIVHIAGGGSGGSPSRREGYEQAMVNRGLGQHIRVVAGGSTEEGGYQGARRVIADGEATAVFAFNDLVAIGALTAIEEAGLRVPADLSLVGYDDTHLAALRHLSLTSVSQPMKAIGRLAVDMVMERLKQPRSRARHVVLEPELIVRSSSAQLRTIETEHE